MARRLPLIANRRTALLLGVACLVAGSYLVYDAYEGRGVTRPFVVRFLPGP